MYSRNSKKPNTDKSNSKVNTPKASSKNLESADSDELMEISGDEELETPVADQEVLLIEVEEPVLEAAPNAEALQEIEQELEIENAGKESAVLSAATNESLANADSLGMYLREIGGLPLLTFQEELSLGQLIAAGRVAEVQLISNSNYSKEQLNQIKTDGFASSSKPELKQLELEVIRGTNALDRLVRSNLRLVVSVARKYRERGLTFLDLIQEGNLGLIRAAEKYDYKMGYKFSTYATWWIRQAITRAIADQARLIRLPVHIGERLTTLNQAKRQLAQELGREPIAEEIAQLLKLPVEEVIRLQKLEQHTVSLDSPIGDEGDSSLGDIVEDNRSQLEVENSGNDSLLKEDVNQVLAHLSDREALVVRLRYGLDNNSGQGRTLEEVGKELGVTRERVRQIEAKALRKLRHPKFGKKLRAYLD